MCAPAISGRIIKINDITDSCENQWKVEAPFTLQIAAVRNTFSMLRGFAIPHPPFSGVSSLFYLSTAGLTPGGFFLGSDTGEPGSRTWRCIAWRVASKERVQSDVVLLANGGIDLAGRETGRA